MEVVRPAVVKTVEAVPIKSLFRKKKLALTSVVAPSPCRNLGLLVAHIVSQTCLPNIIAHTIEWLKMYVRVFCFRFKEI